MALPPDPWSQLRQHTSARIALGRIGSSLPTREVLSFALAHAQARDAVHARFDPKTIAAGISRLGLRVVEVESEAVDRAAYLARPDLGRQLDRASRGRLTGWQKSASPDVLVVVGDGLSATAVAANAVPVIASLVPHLTRLGHSLGPVILAEGARVALGDEIGEILGARITLMMIGERPGLSSADSMSAYLTFDPRRGRTDAQRNCISNIRSGGLDPGIAASNLAWLAEMAIKLEISGTALKDDSSIRPLLVTAP